MRVFLNRSFYPLTSAHPVSVLILRPTERSGASQTSEGLLHLVTTNQPYFLLYDITDKVEETKGEREINKKEIAKKKENKISRMAQGDE